MQDLELCAAFAREGFAPVIRALVEAEIIHPFAPAQGTLDQAWESVDSAALALLIGGKLAQPQLVLLAAIELTAEVAQYVSPEAANVLNDYRKQVMGTLARPMPSEVVSMARRVADEVRAMGINPLTMLVAKSMARSLGEEAEYWADILAVPEDLQWRYWALRALAAVGVTLVEWAQGEVTPQSLVTVVREVAGAMMARLMTVEHMPIQTARIACHYRMLAVTKQLLTVEAFLQPSMVFTNQKGGDA